MMINHVDYTDVVMCIYMHTHMHAGVHIHNQLTQWSVGFAAESSQLPAVHFYRTTPSKLFTHTDLCQEAI